jgi:hypothetical protein
MGAPIRALDANLAARPIKAHLRVEAETSYTLVRAVYADSGMMHASIAAVPDRV